jgi:hypothetical protein
MEDIMASRAKAVSIASLTKAIDAGVKLAAKRHGVTLGGDTVIKDWEILGRILRDRGNLTNPLDVAQTIATGGRLKGTPVAAKIGKDILVGVIPLNVELNLRR